MSQPPYDPNNPNQQPFDPNNPYGNNPGNPQQNQGNPWQQNPYQQNPYNPNPNPYQQFPPPNPFLQNNQLNVPNATTVLVLGIVSIVFAFCYGFFGVALGVIGLVMSNRSISLYNANPRMYTDGSYNNLKAGRICAIVGLSIGSIILLVFIVYAVILASFASAFRF